MSNLFATLAAVVTLVTAIIVFRQTTKKVSNQLQEIHILVNSRLTEVLTRVDVLTKKLQDEGVEVPNDDSSRPRRPA